MFEGQGTLSNDEIELLLLEYHKTKKSYGEPYINFDGADLSRRNVRAEQLANELMNDMGRLCDRLLLTVEKLYTSQELDGGTKLKNA